MVRCFPWLLLFFPSAAAAAEERAGDATIESSRKCDRLPTSLTYTQEKAPRDISGVLPVVVEKVNRELEGVVDVEVEWTGGNMHRKVGVHTVQCSVTRLVSAVSSREVQAENVSTDSDGRKVIVQCFHVPFTILDTDECSLPAGHSMRHKCRDPALCVNTVGSYECLCSQESGELPSGTVDAKFWEDVASQTRGPWELSLDSKIESSCPANASTHGCCDESGHSSQGSACRAAFRCPRDPCRAGGSKKPLHDCASNARCQRTDSPLDRPNFECRCPHGLMGNGHICRAGIDPKPQPRVRFDGVTPTEETVKNNYYCGCTKPIVDACAGFPPCTGKHEVCTVTASNTPVCACQPGFVNNHDGYGCVDETPPILKLRADHDGNGVTRLKQGDLYKEHAVDIIDDNAEHYLRSLKITYSEPLPPGCLTKMGSFHVNFTVATPWTSPPYVRVTRTVIIEDVDECSLEVEKYEVACPSLIPQCDVEAGAKCVNTIGSYTCQCPKYTSGDGFKSISNLQPDSRGEYGKDAPEGYNGGTGCRDTSKPVIDLLGPQPKVFKVCKCGGLTGIMDVAPSFGGDAATAEELRSGQRKRYEGDIKEMIHSTSGAELCATHMRPNPELRDCVTATDHTYKGSIDLTSRVIIGDPVQKSALQWSVPYNVVDDAGNEATTVWRDVVVEEVDLYDLENRIRAEVLAEKELAVKQAVKKALKEERKRNEQLEIAHTNKKERTKVRGKQDKKPIVSHECPSCPECICEANHAEFDKSKCDEICNERIAALPKTCVSDDGKAVPDRATVASQSIAPDGFTSPFFNVLHWLESIFPPSLILVVLLCSTAAVLLVITQRIIAYVFNTRDDSFYFTRADEERERAMRNSVMYYNSPSPSSVAQSSGGTPGRIGGMSPPGSASSAPPRASMSLGRNAGNGMFSPQENRVYGQERPVVSPTSAPTSWNTPSRQEDNDDNIYQTMSPITPSRSNGTPYNLRRRY